MYLSQLFLLSNIPLKVQKDIDIKGLARDSRDVKPGFLFAAIDGQFGSGCQYIQEAIQNGACVILTNHPHLETSVPVYYINNIEEALSLICVHFYSPHPQHLAAVTGTNGKTSTVFFLRQIWEHAGYKSASLGTLGVQSENYMNYSGMTTSDNVTLNKDLQILAQTGVTHAALEASSHGLDQHRLSGLIFEATAFTNLTRDHLDYHKTMERYLKAKTHLFTELTKPNGYVVLNADIPEFETLNEICLSRGLKILSYGFKGKDLKLVKQKLHTTGQDLKLIVLGHSYHVTLPVAGAFQGMNMLCALGLAIGTGVPVQTALESLKTLKAPDGRMELVGQTQNGASIFVDYAHTPDGLETALKSLRQHTKNKLHVVFGCGGNRDKGKRPLMGEIAQKLADEIIITDDNPRFENPDEIRQQILIAAPKAIEVSNRASAILKAISHLKAGDVLLLAGKGHEEGQLINGKMYPFNDRIQVLLALKTLNESPLWTKEELYKATGCMPLEEVQAFGVSINTLFLRPGDIFIALNGHGDGHKYVEQAFKKGAVLAIVNHPINIPDANKLLIVPDTLKALYDLASFAKKRSSAIRIGITGSSGKTTTKEMLAKALSSQGKVHATIGNLNNKLGVPLTLARLPKDADFAVFEMGMNHFGELTYLSELVEPKIVLITMIGLAHLEFFKSETEIAHAKAEIFSHVLPNGIAVLNADSPFFDFLKQEALKKGIRHILSFGEKKSATTHILKQETKNNQTTIKAQIADTVVSFTINSTGKHFIQNALSALTVVNALGGDLTKASTELSCFSIVNGRGNFIQCTHNHKTFTIIDDAYNANPSSMAASIQVLGAQSGRKIAVLGDMLELGDSAEILHINLIKNLLEIQVDKVYAVGIMMKKLYDNIPQKIQGAWAEKASDILPALENELLSGDTVLIKASNSMHFYEIVKKLTK